MPNLIVPSAVRSLHNIFTSIWIGGMLAMVISVLPSIRKEIKDPALQGSVIDNIMSRHSKWVYPGIVVLAVTGILMARLSGSSSGLLNFTNSYAAILSIKHILMLLVSAIAVVRSTVFKNAASGKDKSKKKLSMALLMVNTFMGVVILVLSSIIAVIG
jgi:uncharacterized membrane protein